MSGKEFDIVGWKAEKPIHFGAAGRARVEALMNICNEEIALIDREIRQFSIPFPQQLMPARRRFQIEVHEASPSAPPDTARDPASAPPAGPPANGWDGRHSGAAERVTQLFPIALSTLRSARGGPIVIVGGSSRARALSAFFRLVGRDSIRLEPGYGAAGAWIVPGVLRRPSDNSFFHWLSIDPSNRLKQTGAIVFLDPYQASNDLKPLAGLSDHTPPIILPTALAHRAATSRAIGLGYAAIPAGTPLCKEPPANSWPKISIVTPSFNQVQYIEATLRSVLDQDYPNLEYIVVDGGSTDGSIDIIEKYRSRLTHVIIEPDEGQSDALNKGFRLATGEIMNWLCSDDMIEPGTLHRVGDTYRTFKPDFVVGACVRIGESRAAEIFHHHSAIPFDGITTLSFDDMLRFTRSWQKANYFFQPEVFFSRRIWESSGAFIKKHLYYAMDYELWLRMAMSGATVMHVPDTFGCSRVHEAQKTQDDRIYLHQLRQIMEEYRDLLKQVYEVA